MAVGLFFLGGQPDSAGKGGKGKRAQVPVVTVAPAGRKDVPVYLDGLGTVQAYNTVTVHTQIDGQLMAVLFREGQDVHKGDVLAKIDPRTYQAQFDQAVATKAKDAALLENARRDLKRYINLGNTVSGQVLDTQRSLVKQLDATVKFDQANIENARALLSYTIIAAPISGRTGLRQVDVGNIVHAGDANGLVVLTQLQPISVVFSLPQQDLSAINAASGKLQTLAVDASSHTTVDTGVLELVDNQIDQTTGTVKLKATFPNAKRALWPGGFTNIRLLVSTRKNSLVVPNVSVQHGPQGTYVFVLGGDSTVELRAVKTDMSDEQDAVITDGLKDGEQVVTDGAGKLEDGAKVALPEKAAPEGKSADASAKSMDGSEKGAGHAHGKKGGKHKKKEE